VVNTIDEECRRIAADGLAPEELARTQARMATHLLRDTDAVLGRGLQIAVLEQQRGEPELLGELPRLTAQVTEEQIVAAAATLTADRRACVEVIPGGAR
jgi:predicted Zn-dependent peptidase